MTDPAALITDEEKELAAKIQQSFLVNSDIPQHDGETFLVTDDIRDYNTEHLKAIR